MPLAVVLDSWAATPASAPVITSGVGVNTAVEFDSAGRVLREDHADTTSGGPANARVRLGDGKNAFNQDAFAQAFSAFRGTRDTITDFQHGADKIALDRTVFTKFTTPGPLPAANFAINTPRDTNDYIVYNTTTGALSYDSNRNGAGCSTQFATLTHVPGITQADFLVF